MRRMTANLWRGVARVGYEVLHTEPVGCSPWCEEYVGAGAYVASTSECIPSYLIRVEPNSEFALPAIEHLVIASEVPTSCVGGYLAKSKSLMRCSRQVQLPDKCRGRTECRVPARTWGTRY
jgi:hypothetical protein